MKKIFTCLIIFFIVNAFVQTMCYARISVQSNQSALISNNKNLGTTINMRKSILKLNKNNWFNYHIYPNYELAFYLDDKTSIKNIHLVKGNYFDSSCMDKEKMPILVAGTAKEVGDLMIYGKEGDWGIFKKQDVDEYMLAIFDGNDDINYTNNSNPYIVHPIICTKNIEINRIDLDLHQAFDKVDFYENQSVYILFNGYEYQDEYGDIPIVFGISRENGNFCIYIHNSNYV